MTTLEFGTTLRRLNSRMVGANLAFSRNASDFESEIQKRRSKIKYFNFF